MFLNNVYVVAIGTLLCFCACQSTPSHTYPDDIGDTVFNKKLDDEGFQFCDEKNVLHSRSRIRYNEGQRGLERDFLKAYTHKPAFNVFSGYFFIRMAVNCENQTGRFRWDVVDDSFLEISCPKQMESEVMRIVRSLDQWNHPVYEGSDYDGYTYFILEFNEGKLVVS